MDIAKYIGLFLLKNNFCYIHGLGNLVLKKRPAQYDGQVLQAPQYEAVLTPGGSIDDSLANFIATHEQTSISKAANSLRDFSVQSRADLNAGKEVPIPSIGKFVMNNGVVAFVTDPHMQYTPPSIPALRTASRVTDVPTFKTTVTDAPANRYEDHPADRPATNWGRIILVAAIVIVVGVGGYMGYRYYQQNGQASEAQPVANNDSTETLLDAPTVVPPVPSDSTTGGTDSTGAANTATNANGNGWSVLLNTYRSLPAAQKRYRSLNDNGNRVELLTKDSTSYFIVMPMTAPIADSVHTLDSLRGFFNPKGVSIYR